MTGIQLHPRHSIVAKARASISKSVLDVMKEHDLTYAELFGILLGELQGWNSEALREERRPDSPGKPADEA